MIEPFKVVCQVIAADKDDDGNVCAEQHVADIVLYRSQFGELETRVEAVFEAVHAQQNGQAPKGAKAKR